MADEDTSDDDSVPTLSADTMAALQQFYAEQDLQVTTMAKAPVHESDQKMPPEDWQLSQFWYDEQTADTLAKEVMASVDSSARIACISCPTLYHRLRAVIPDTWRAVIFEYDTRFSMFGDDFVFYDYNIPDSLPVDLHKTFDIVVVDPPFLSTECLSKVFTAVNHLAKGKVLLCTGAVMEDTAEKLLGLKKCRFIPRHSHNLANEFRCFSNYNTAILDNVVVANS